jgi:DNA-binding NarL/FixJ family response regulator
VIIGVSLSQQRGEPTVRPVPICSTPVEEGDNPSLGSCSRVVVQHRQRLLRLGISQMLATEDDLEVVAMAATDAELLPACHRHRPSVALIEGDAGHWDVLRLVAGAKRVVPGLVVVGLTAAPATLQEVRTARRGGMSALVPRDAGITGIVTALREATDPRARARRTSLARPAPSSSPPTTMLTNRELEILSLVGAGLTSAAASRRLNISHKTVENHKQRIFAKLGVQNQAHAVSVAMRTGLMRPERMMDLALAD